MNNTMWVGRNEAILEQYEGQWVIVSFRKIGSFLFQFRGKLHCFIDKNSDKMMAEVQNDENHQKAIFWINDVHSTGTVNLIDGKKLLNIYLTI